MSLDSTRCLFSVCECRNISDDTQSLWFPILENRPRFPVSHDIDISGNHQNAVEMTIFKAVFRIFVTPPAVSIGQAFARKPTLAQQAAGLRSSGLIERSSTLPASLWEMKRSKHFSCIRNLFEYRKGSE